MQKSIWRMTNLKAFDLIARIFYLELNHLSIFSEMEVQLDDFQEGRPMMIKMNQETAQKVKQLKGKKQYKELMELALAMPSTKQKYLLLSNAYLHLKKWKQLADTCDKGLDLCDDNEASDFFNLKGKALGKQGNFEQKIRLTTKAIEINPRVAAYHRNLGAAYYKLKQYEKAIQCHNKAIDIEPKHSINYHNKGAAFFRMGQYQNAVQCFQKAVELDKKQTISYGWLADSYKQLKEYKVAEAYYLRAYEISAQEQYKKSAREMEQKADPGRKKGFFSKLFG